MKKIPLMLGVLLILGVLTGCSNYADTYNRNTLVINGNGSIIEVAVENYEDSSVTAESLKTYIDEQIEAYNTEQGKKVIKNKSLNTEDMSNVKLVLSYEDMESYNGFNLLECSLKDFLDADEEELKESFTSIDGDSVKASEIEDTKKAKMLVMSEATDVVVKGDILYYNDEVSVKDGVATTTGEADAIIIFK